MTAPTTKLQAVMASEDGEEPPASTRGQRNSRGEADGVADALLAETKISRPAPPTQIPGPTTPSTAAVQRATSASRTNTSSLDATAESSKERGPRNGHNSPSWPTSPRLKSPPPSILRTKPARRNDDADQAQSNQSNTAVKRLAPVSAPDLGAAMQLPLETTKEPTVLSSLRGSGRAANVQPPELETVDEGSAPTTPSIGPITHPQLHDAIVEASNLDEPSLATVNGANDKGDTTPTPDALPALTVDPPETGSLSAPASRATSTSRPQAAASLAKRSFTSLTAKKLAMEPLRTMTVETEPVNSTGPMLGDRGRDTGGLIGHKPSTETIRPRKEKRKASRKTPSLHAGTGTSKADIFEAKVASAVDEADSSDSDETFVYESNPPEPRATRHHSRTPSATSMTSQMDHFNRGKHGVRGGSAAIAGKKSMKFSSSAAFGHQLEANGSGGETGRSSLRTTHATPRHHHIGRHGRNGHPSIIDNDSPFAQTNRSALSPRTPAANGHRHSQPTSPRMSNGRLPSGRKSITGGYDTYDDGADDERAPLMGSVRINRNRHSRRPNGQFRTMEFAEYPQRQCWPRFGGCLLLAVVIVAVVTGITTFVLALNRPLQEVEVRHIQNVLASEEELMVDLHVRAINPNLFAIAVTDLDVDLFAESPYAGTEREWLGHTPPRIRQTRMQRRATQSIKPRQLSSWFPPLSPSDGVDEGTDPIDDPETGNKKLRLGRIYRFDAPLMFEASPFRHEASSSVGEIRLARPGNKTVLGGSERWQRTIQHDFDLIVRGVLQYQLPFSSHIRSAKIGARITVSPDRDDDGSNSTTRAV